MNSVDLSLDRTFSNHKHKISWTRIQDRTKPSSIMGPTWSGQIAPVFAFWVEVLLGSSSNTNIFSPAQCNTLLLELSGWFRIGTHFRNFNNPIPESRKFLLCAEHLHCYVVSHASSLSKLLLITFWLRPSLSLLFPVFMQVLVVVISSEEYSTCRNIFITSCFSLAYHQRGYLVSLLLDLFCTVQL